MRRATKRKRLSPQVDMESGLTAEPDPQQNSIAHGTDPIKHASSWNLEQVYEQRARRQNGKVKEHTRLPIKTAEGKIEQLELPNVEQEGLDSVVDCAEEETRTDCEGSEPSEEVPQLPLREQVASAKEELARLARQINEDPEENVGGFKTLAQISSSPHPTIKRLALATQMAVFRDVIPGYRIRPLSATDQKVRLSKDIRKLRNFEQSLISAYQAYLKNLALYTNRRARDGSAMAASLASIALSCACALLLAVPHFNFRGDLLQIVIAELGRSDQDVDYVKCLRTIETLFHDDEDCTPSFEAMGMLAKMIKAHNFQVDASVLDTFLHLRLLSEFSSKASRDGIDKGGSEDVVENQNLKFKKEFRTKKQRKVIRERKKTEKQFKEADALVDYEHRDRMQAETLKLVFGTYFRILRARKLHLMGAVLEGLAKYAHLINQDFFGDILEVLKDLIKDVELAPIPKQIWHDSDDDTIFRKPNQDATRSALLAVNTAFTLLEGQDVAKSASSLGLDLRYFITCLYKSLYHLSMNPDVELAHKKPTLPNSKSAYSVSSGNPSTFRDPSKINVQTTAVLLLRALALVLKPRTTPPLRLAAFTKQLLTISLHLPERSSLAMLDQLNNVAKIHTQKLGALWNTEERRGDGVFDPTRPEVDGSNPFATTVWEGELLKYHFCPNVRESTKGIEKVVRSLT